MTRLYWVSLDKQSSIPMGDYDSSELAHVAIEACRVELLAQCADDNQRAAIEAGTWEVTAFEAQEARYAMPFMLIDTSTGCPHACDYLIVRTTSHYDATQLVCPRNCVYPKTDIHWRAS